MMAAAIQKEARSMGRRSNFTSKHKAEIVLSVLTKQVTAAEACRRHGITETTLARWRELALEGVVKGLEGRDVGTRRESELEREIAALERKLGQVTMIADLRSKALQRLT
jgi:transposase-like protein